MQRVRAIFFDIGDTLVFDDPPLRGRLAQALRAVDIRFDPSCLPQAYRFGEEYALSHYLQGVPWDDPAVMRESTQRILSGLDVLPLTEERWRTLWEAYASVPFTRTVHPQATPLLEELRRRGFVVGAISDWEETLPELLAELSLAPHLDALAVSAIVGVTKPAPALFREALRQANVAPETSLHVGDWYALDVAGARAVGMQALLFDHAGRSPDADCPRVETFKEMQDYLLALPTPPGTTPPRWRASASRRGL